MRVMAKNETTRKVGAALRLARQQRSLVQRQIAAQMGVTVTAVGQWEIGANLPKTENLIKLAKFLRIDGAALSRGEIVYTDDEAPGDAGIVTDMMAPPSGPRDVEHLGTAVGGDDGDFTFNGEVMGYVQRPVGIAHLRKVFAIDVLSDSMYPRFKPGEMVYCGGRDPVPGDDVVIEMLPEGESPVGKAFIKNLVKRTVSELIVEQYNPRKEITFNRYEIKRVWRVIPLKELLGY